MLDGRQVKEELGLIVGGLIIAACLAGAVVETWEKTDNVVIESSLLSCHTITLPCTSEIKAATVCHGMDRALCKAVLYDISSSECHIYSYSLKGRFTVSSTPTSLISLESLCDADDYDDADHFKEMTRSSHCMSQSFYDHSFLRRRDCQAHHDAGVRVDGVYTLRNGDGTYFDVWCEFDTNNGWTVIQRRQDGSQDFNLLWADYKQGFGNLNNEYWLGNDFIHLLTKYEDQRLHISLIAVNGSEVTADYALFYIGDEAAQYSSYTDGFNGQHGDLMGPSNNVGFSTADVDNDLYDGYDCAGQWTGGWWFVLCGVGNLNGIYGQGNAHRGIFWYPYQNRYDDNFVKSVMKMTRG